MIVDCIQGERLDRLEDMQTNQMQVIKELNQTIRDALFSTELHPDNGLINQMKNMKETLKKQDEDMVRLDFTVKELTQAVKDLRTVISGITTYMEDINKFKIATETAQKVEKETLVRELAAKEKSQKTLQWVVGTSVVVILSLLGYIIARPSSF